MYIKFSMFPSFYFPICHLQFYYSCHVYQYMYASDFYSLVILAFLNTLSILLYLLEHFCTLMNELVGFVYQFRVSYYQTNSLGICAVMCLREARCTCAHTIISCALASYKTFRLTLDSIHYL